MHRYGNLTETGTGVNGYGFANYGQTQNVTTKSYFDFIKSFGNIGVSAVLGTEFQYTIVDNARAEGQQFPLDEYENSCQCRTYYSCYINTYEI